MEAPVETPVIAPPKLRGWFHLGATPVVVIASLVLFILSKESLKFAVALYSLTAITLFSVSAIYHRVPWSPAKKKIWRRWDHANINLLIAGSYTPFAMTLLEGTDRTICLSVVWIGALLGVAMRIFWLGAPRWLYVINYLALGWVAVFYTPQLYKEGGLWVLIPILIVQDIDLGLLLVPRAHDSTKHEVAEFSRLSVKGACVPAQTGVQ